MVAGNTKLNFAFVANLFNTHPGLEPLSQADKETLDESMFDSAGDREARAFALWLNSLGVDPFVNNLFDDLGVRFWAFLITFACFQYVGWTGSAAGDGYRPAGNCGLEKGQQGPSQEQV